MGDARTVFEASCRDPQLPPDDPRHDGPVVSLVVVTRDGLHHLRRLFDGLRRRTRYRSFEVVVVDNGSTDGTLEWLEDPHPFPVRVVANDENQSFSHANNQGLELVRGDITLVCNNDVDPVHPDWLTRLVIPLADDEVAATGPVLVYPEPDPAVVTRLRHPALTVQSAGIGFALDDGRVRARNLDQGTDPLRPLLRRTRVVPGLTAACLAVRTRDLRTLGGFDERYFYGSEDWDLCLRLARLGELQLVGRSVVYHHEFATQGTIERRDRLAYWQRNHRIFNATWGARVRRDLLTDHLGGDGRAVGTLRSTLVLEPPEDPRLGSLAAGLRALGWEEHRGGEHPPTLELTAGGHDDAPSSAGLCVAVARRGRAAPVPARAHVVVGIDGREPFSDARVAVAAEHAHDGQTGGEVDEAIGLLRAVATTLDRPRIAVRVGDAPEVAASPAADERFAAGLVTAFARAGLEAHSRTHAGWAASWGEPVDVVVHLRGRTPLQVEQHPIDVLWIIDHGEPVTDDELAAVDVVLVASATAAGLLRSRTSTPVHVLHRAADTTRFRPRSRGPQLAAGTTVVAGPPRFPIGRAARYLAALGCDFEVYDEGWRDGPFAAHVAATGLSPVELSDVFAAAAVVVTDQAAPAAEAGFVSQELFDVAAAGGFAVSDGGPGVADVFGELVPVYSGPQELAALLERSRRDPAEHDRLAAAAMRHVRGKHSLDVRVRRLLELLDLPG